MLQSFQVDDNRASLRQRAVAKLTVSTLADPKRSSMSDALVVLHHLASSPATAVDALALLHELQVHQVELDLQQDELHDSRAELETALSRQTALIERAPVGYMTVDAATVLGEINLVGAQLLGASQQELLGRPLSRWLSEPSADALRTLLSRARDGQVSETCNLQLQPVAGVPRTVHAAVSKDTASDHFLLVLMAAATAEQADT